MPAEAIYRRTEEEKLYICIRTTYMHHLTNSQTYSLSPMSILLIALVNVVYALREL